MAKTYRLTDASGAALGAFDEIESAHLWAHRFARSPATTPPVELRDLDSPAVRRISAKSCELCVPGVVVACPRADGSDAACCSDRD